MTDHVGRLATDGGDDLEVVVAMHQGQTEELGRRGDDEIHRTGAAVPAAPGEQPLDLPGPPVGPVRDRAPHRKRAAAPTPHHTRTTPPGANAGLVAFGGIFSRGSAMSVILGPTRAARGARRVRSKP